MYMQQGHLLKGIVTVNDGETLQACNYIPRG